MPDTAAHLAAATPRQLATRIQTSALTGVEKRVLLWMARRLPAWVTSDRLTVLALVSMAGAGLSYWLASITPLGLVLASACLAVNWFGDSLDGTLARVRQQERPRYGYYVDHVLDAAGAVFLFAGLGLSGHMAPWVAAGLLVAYFLLCVEVYLAAHTVGRFEMSFFKMGPTELRLLLVAGNVTLLVNPDALAFGGALSLFDAGGVLGIAGLVVTFLYSAVRHTLALYRAEPLPLRDRS